MSMDQQQSQSNTTANYRVMRRNGKVTRFDKEKIKVAMSKSFLAVEGDSASASQRIHETVDNLTDQVCYALMRSRPSGGTFHIEDIQDQVELSLMRAGEHKIARSYVIYREEHARNRAAIEAEIQPAVESTEIAPTEVITALQESQFTVLLANGSRKPLDVQRLQTVINEACQDLEEVDQEQILKEVRRNLYDGVTEKELSSALVMSASILIEREPNYSQVAARLLMDRMRHEALSFLSGHHSEATQQEMAERYPHYFAQYIKRAAELELVDEKLANEYDLDHLGHALLPERDNQFTYLGLQTLYDRYFIHHRDTRFELPQAFFMRVAMGLAINEVDRESRAIEFYQLLSSFDFMSSTPTLFNSGTLRPQLSSCYLTTVPDDLYGIFDAIKDDAMLSKFAGGLGNDWTPVRAMGSHIKGTNGKSQGVVPFLKVANDTAVAVNQCFAADTLLHTGDGLKKIKDVEVGDLVLGQRGHYREVQKRFAYNQTDAMVEIKVKHSISPLQVTAGHPLWSLTDLPLGQANSRSYRQLESGKINPVWRDAGELKKGDFVAQVIPQEVLPVDGFDDDDARLYGILLGDGHCSKNGLEWGVSGNPNIDSEHLQFVRNYLEERGLHYWQSAERENYLQICWAQNCGLAREASSGQFVCGSSNGFTFNREELYGADGKKRIARRYAHLPRSQTLALIQGLIETDGNVSRGKEISFSNTSQTLIEGLRYQLLRLGVPAAGQYRERQQDHQGQRADGSLIQFNGLCKSYDLRIPAIKEIAERVGCKPLKKENWLHWNGHIFSRIRSVTPMAAVPFVYDLKVEGDESYMTTSALAHNGGKRKGAMCAYLETWHLDIEDFLELRKNTGDERRRTHDMNSANWIPDLFMKRVSEEASWTLFSPDDTPDLHDLYGSEFEARYCEYEQKSERGEIKLSKQVPAQELWRKMLGLLFETGHPWITFKDPCNIRSPQQHVGVVHSSNLCTEITLNTSSDEIAVCNLGSINLPAHIGADGQLDSAKLQRTITTAMRMLDNVIDYNYYSVAKARRSNLRHRPVGMGLMGFQDALYKMRTPYSSNEAVQFADTCMETISYFAIQASSDLAAERGTYKSYKGSLWDQGILPIDSLQTLADSRGDYLQTDMSQSLDWDSLRQTVKKQGMRNSNTMAIAPTATISNICGVTQSIEPTYQNLFVKSNLSGEFTVVNPHLVHDLKQLGLWDQVMVNDLKYYDGSLQTIDRVPDDLKALYATAFEMDARWLIEAAARRQKWLDQAQSLNLYMAEPSGPKLDNMYKLAWIRGLKTTYYLRSIGATAAEKTSVDNSDEVEEENSAPKMCSIMDPDCEACQ